MDLKELMNQSIFGVLIEGIGFIAIFSILLKVICGGELGNVVRLFASAICG